MQRLVYILIGLAGLAVAAAAYFGFTFSVIEAFVTALAFCAVALLLMERRLRRRSEADLGTAIDDLGRILATNANANAALTDRLNAMADDDTRARVEALEADVGVLGTVARQVAEALADLEQRLPELSVPVAAAVVPAGDLIDEPTVPLEAVRQAIADNRLICHIQPIALLPGRKPRGYAVIPRLMLENGELAEAQDFMPRRGGADIVAYIDAMALNDALVIARRGRNAGHAITLHVPLSLPTLADEGAMQRLLATLEANHAVGQFLVFAIEQAAYRTLTGAERGSLVAIARTGAGFSLVAATSLRIDFAELQGLGFRYVCVDAGRFIASPQSYTDFHSADVAAYGQRYGIEMIGTGTADEEQLLRLFEDGISLVRGPHIGSPGPVRTDLMPDRTNQGVAPQRIGA